MGVLANSLFAILLGWTRMLFQALWDLLDTDRTTLLELLGHYWLPISLVILVIGLVGDWVVWLIRWRPYHIWAVRIRRFLHISDDVVPDASDFQETEQEEPADEPEEDSWLPLEKPVMTKADIAAAEARAEAIPDEELGDYPGKRFVETRRYEGASGLRKSEGDARVLNMADYAANKAEEEKDEDTRKVEKPVEEAEQEYQEKLSQYEEEMQTYRRKKAEYDAYMAQKAAEEEYQRKMAEYEKEMAEYQLKKAAYDEAMRQREEKHE